MYLVLTCMPGESYRRRLRSLLLCLRGVFRALINNLVCWFCLLNTHVWKSGKHNSESSHFAPSSLRQRHHGQGPLSCQKYQTLHQTTFFCSLMVNSKLTCFICCREFCHYNVCPQEKKRKKVPLREFMYLIFTHMPGESSRRLVFVVVLLWHLTSDD